MASERSGTDMVWAVPRTDVLLKVLGGPYRSELVGTAFRLTQALLDCGATVQVWACGDATGLTSTALGDTLPVNLLDRDRSYPSTAALVRALVTGHPGRLSWYACRFCCQERGRSAQIAQVRMRPPARFWEHVDAAGKVLVLGAS
ncbi:MAG TPA: hypothetical protein VFB84_12490 [Micromonosporaceae bacterium]|nr:hypothetical protein [Micromonosporaceae bacterium]